MEIEYELFLYHASKCVDKNASCFQIEMHRIASYCSQCVDAGVTERIIEKRHG